MSAYAEYRAFLRQGDKERAEQSLREFAHDCRMEDREPEYYDPEEDE